MFLSLKYLNFETLKLFWTNFEFTLLDMQGIYGRGEEIKRSRRLIIFLSRGSVLFSFLHFLYTNIDVRNLMKTLKKRIIRNSDF